MKAVLMRTTLDLPLPLLNAAMKATHLKTKTAVIIEALEDLVRKTRIQELKKAKGHVHLDIDMDTMRGRA